VVPECKGSVENWKQDRGSCVCYCENRESMSCKPTEYVSENRE